MVIQVQLIYSVARVALNCDELIRDGHKLSLDCFRPNLLLNYMSIILRKDSQRQDIITTIQASDNLFRNLYVRAPQQIT